MYAHLATVLADCVTATGADCNHDETPPLGTRILVLLVALGVVVLTTLVGFTVALVKRSRGDQTLAVLPERPFDR